MQISRIFFKFLIYGLIHCSIMNLLISSELFFSPFATDKCVQNVSVSNVMFQTAFVHFYIRYFAIIKNIAEVEEICS